MTLFLSSVATADDPLTDYHWSMHDRRPAKAGQVHFASAPKDLQLHGRLFASGSARQAATMSQVLLCDYPRAPPGPAQRRFKTIG